MNSPRERREPHPGLHEVKHIYQYVHCKAADLAARKVEVKNWYDFINLKDFATVQWKLTGNGRELQRGEMPAPDLAPHATESNANTSINNCSKCITTK